MNKLASACAKVNSRLMFMCTGRLLIPTMFGESLRAKLESFTVGLREVPALMFAPIEKTDHGYGFVLAKADTRTALEAAADNDRECELELAGAGWKKVTV